MSDAQKTNEQVKLKQRWYLYGIVGVFALLGIIAVLVMPRRSSNVPDKPEGDFTSPLQNFDAGTILLDKIEARVTDTERVTDALTKKVDALDEPATLAPEPIPEVPPVKEVKELPEPLPQEIFPAKEVSGDAIKEDVIALQVAKPVPEQSRKNPDNYVPAGTFVRAIALGGADASSAVNAQANPVPMLFRIIENGTLPNNRYSHLKDCLVTAAVVGDISSERGLIRLENLSCIGKGDPKGEQIIDIAVHGTVFGSEGKNGIRGRPLWREKALLQRAFVAGTLSGLANGLTQKYTTTAVSPLGSTKSVEPQDIFKYGASNGLGNAMEKLADYNIQRAEQYHPVLQLTAGTIVDIVFLRGFYLEEQGHERVEMQAENISLPRDGVAELGTLPEEVK
jgi:hypothetical protein